MKHRPFEKYFQQNPIEPPAKDSSILPERISQKEIDIFCRELLADHPELREAIVHHMADLQTQDLPMPVIHISSRAAKRDNEIVSTGFVENIQTKGLRKRDTNVGVFVEKTHCVNS